MFKKIIKNILKNNFLRKIFLKLFIFLNNFSYNWIKFFVINKGIHPKHQILQYDKFFLNNLDKNCIILDIGCGNGHLANKLSEKVQRIIAIDISGDNIAIAKKKFRNFNIQFIVGDAIKYDFKEKFDVIILSNVLEHIEERISFLQKLHQLSSKILIRVPMIDRDWLTVYKKENGYEYRLDDTHFIEYTTKTLKNELRQSGWELEKYSIQFGEIWGIVIKKNYVKTNC